MIFLVSLCASFVVYCALWAFSKWPGFSGVLYGIGDFFRLHFFKVSRASPACQFHSRLVATVCPSPAGNSGPPGGLASGHRGKPADTPQTLKQDHGGRLAGFCPFFGPPFAIKRTCPYPWPGGKTGHTGQFWPASPPGQNCQIRASGWARPDQTKARSSGPLDH